MMKIDPGFYARLKQTAPGVHAISNQVTANDCANLLLAVGAKPIMARAAEEMDEITAVCAATVLNLGTPDDAKYAACEAAGRAANRLKHPVTLDPVGVGASRYRLRHTAALLDAVRPAVIRANLAEAEALLGRFGQEAGVDSAAGSRERALLCAKALAGRYGCAVLLSGPEDIVTDGGAAFAVNGGSDRLRRITGAGCMLSALCGAAAVCADPLTAALTAAAGWKHCARAAEIQIGPRGGIGSLHMALMDQAEALAEADLSDVTIEEI